MAVVDELVTLLGLEIDPSAENESGKFQKTLDGVRTIALAAGTALVALAGGTFALSKRFAETTDSAKKFADSIDFDFQSLQELEFAVTRSGGSVEGLRADLEKLTQTYGNGEGALRNFAARFEGLSNRRAQQLGGALGLSQDTILLLQQGTTGIAKLRAEARTLGGIIPDDLANRTADFNDELTNLSAITAGINNRLQAALIPSFVEATQSLRIFLVENQDVIGSGLETFIKGVQQGFSDFGEILTTVTDTVSSFLSPVFEMGEGLDFVGIIGNTVLGVLTALGIALLPFAIKLAVIAAAIAAVVIVADDLITFFQGGESVIGSFFDSFEKRFPALFDLLSAAVDLFKSFFGLLVDGSNLTTDHLLSLVPVIGEFLGLVGDGLESLAKFLGFGQQDDEGRPQSRDTREISALPSSRVQTPASIVNSSLQQRGGDVNQTFNINGAGDPRAVGNEVARRGGMGNTAQTLTPGQRAPRVS